jgi:hypothetical protein
MYTSGCEVCEVPSSTSQDVASYGKATCVLAQLAWPAHLLASFEAADEMYLNALVWVSV